MADRPQARTTRTAAEPPRYLFVPSRWTETERRTCGVSKCVHCMWDYAGFDPSALEGLEGMHVFDALCGELN